MSDFRCWLCGAEAEAIDVSTWGDVAQGRRAYIPGAWDEPPTDGHEHATQPPTPGQLLAAGARAFDRLMSIWAE